MKVVYSAAYDELFTKAEALLKESNVTNEGKEIVIKDLPTYYRWLDKLEQIGGPEFLRLPLAEDYFRINTDTRQIIVPDMINSNEWVIGVKDDHLAEVLWFHVDRFFDGQDLGICFPIEGAGEQYGQTYVQWKNKNGQGLDPVQHVQIDENNIWFGWYLRSNDGVLNASGDLTFSVRFQYHKGGTVTGPDLTSEVLFSFNTMPVTCKVLTNLTESMGSNITGIHDLKVENTIGQSVIRPRFSNVFNSTEGPKAYIDTDLPKNMDLTEDGTATLYVVADGSGILHYRWYKDGALIAGVEGDSCVVDSVGKYSVQVGNEYAEGKIRWTDSDICEVPEASELEFARDGNLVECGYADGVTTLKPVIEKQNDVFGAKTGNITYQWYRRALEGETLDEEGTTLEMVATTPEYTPIEGEVGYYYVVATNHHNNDESEPLVSRESVMKVPAVEPTDVVLIYNHGNHTFTAEVEIPHKNDLWYDWNIEGVSSTGFVQGQNTFVATRPGEYYCKVKQHIYKGYPTLETAADYRNSLFYTITDADLK